MEIRLLPASTNSPDPSGTADIWTGLASFAHSTLANHPGREIAFAGVNDNYAWSSSAQGNRTNLIYGTPVEDPASQNIADGEYVSGWGSTPPIARSAVAHYLMYTRSPGGVGQLIDVYG